MRVVAMFGAVVIVWLSQRLIQPPLQRIDVSTQHTVLGLCVLHIVAGVLAYLSPIQWSLMGAGGVGILLATVLRVWAIRTLGDQFTGDLRVPTQYITTGPYRWCAHPSYIGAILLYTSLGALWGSALAAGVFVLGTTVLYGQRARVENRLLMQRTAEAPHHA